MAPTLRISAYDELTVHAGQRKQGANLTRTDRREGEAPRFLREGGEEEGPPASGVGATGAGEGGVLSSGGWRRARARAERRGPEPEAAAPEEVVIGGRARSPATGQRREERRGGWDRSVAGRGWHRAGESRVFREWRLGAGGRCLGGRGVWVP